MEQRVIVTVNEGKVRGIKVKSNFSGAEYYSFFGIPYGQNTGGSARFKDPVKVKPWENTFDGSIEKRACCYQFSLAFNGLSGSEDCLFNHIHTPQIPGPQDPLKPVIALIHPGGYAHGSPETHYFGSPDYIMHKGIVYVGIAHRLHLLGFLNLGLEDCSGNQAFKDIILSLQWIQENISVFGGDPNNVTLLGSSSGSALVHGLMLSPKANGLFHKAVMMGVHLFNPTTFPEDDHKVRAYSAAKQLGYNKTTENDERKLLSFFKKLPLEKFILLRPEITMHTGMQLFPCSPFVMTTDQGEKSFFTKRADKLIPSTRRIPLIFGMCEREAAMGFSKLFRKAAKEYFYTSYRQNQWGWGRKITDEQVQQIKNEIEKYYFKGGSLDTASLSDKVDVQTDIAFSNLYTTLLNVISSDLPSSVFVYKFQFEGGLLTLRKKIKTILEENLDGTYHGEDFSYWAHTVGIYTKERPTFNTRTRNMVETFTSFITTFAKTGDPNYEGLETKWKPTTPENPCYLKMNDSLQMVDGKLNNERMLFWENLVERYKKKEDYSEP